MTVADFRARIAKDFGKDALALLAAYPVRDDTEVAAQLAALYSDRGMTCPVRTDARAFAKLGVPTFLYRYEYRYEHAPNILGCAQGAFHGAELVDLFPSRFDSPRFSPVTCGRRRRSSARRSAQSSSL